jgi:hypothetical protein
MRDLPWKSLRLNGLRFVWRVLLHIMLEGFTLVLQVRLWIFFIQGIWSKGVCVLKQRAIEMGPCNIKAWVVFYTFYSLNTVMHFFPIEASCLLLYNSLIIYIDFIRIHVSLFSLFVHLSFLDMITILQTR